MDKEIANSLFGYFKTLYNVNIMLIKLYGSDPYVNCSSDEYDILDLIRELPRIIPYEFSSKTQCLELQNRNGLLEFAPNIPYLYTDYKSILDNCHDFLDTVRLVRNKYEHIMHNVEYRSSCGNSASFSYHFCIEGKSKIISSEDLTNLVKMLNCLFNKMQKDVIDWAINNNATNYPYYNKLLRFQFNDFNTLYESHLLNVFGKTMYDF